MQRIRIEIEGIVQGVGFRPFVFRLAAKHKVSGWVRNTPGGVILEAEAAERRLDEFQRNISLELPPLASITSLTTTKIKPENSNSFEILASSGGANIVQISPDCDVCEDCLRELFDPNDRRYLYPFINCTNCGPRYSIITGIPYDRQFTTMDSFPMCQDCQTEYEDPLHRRFHAQPNACPVCGPQITLTDHMDRAIAVNECENLQQAYLQRAVALLKAGAILAVKGVGGYHLAVDAHCDVAVKELRRRKYRDEKPFALMTQDVERVRMIACCSDIESRLLEGPERPIVLLPKREDNGLSSLVAPLNGYFGVMLPSTPLHYLLLKDNFIALVMTSGNISDEPIVYRDSEARESLAGIADFFLTHNREIHTRSDDSVIRVFMGAPLFVRRSRGYVPRAIKLSQTLPSVLALGGELKTTVCLTRKEQAILSQHIGDLKNGAILRSLEETIAHLEKILGITPEVIAHDLHPDYLSSAFAIERSDLPRVEVQHHHAHMVSCMAENELTDEVIGVILDGTGYGLDGTIWGGEFLVGDSIKFERYGHLRTVAMPGGDAAIREPLRMALSYLHDLGETDFSGSRFPCLSELSDKDKALLLKMLERGVNAPLTSSCGRLFDAVAALLNVRNKISYEGQAGIELEALAERADTKKEYPFAMTQENDGAVVLDMRPMLRELLKGLNDGESVASIARCFHNTVAAAITAMCEVIRSAKTLDRVLLSGGVFQNKLLTEETHIKLAKNGFKVYTHRLVPSNDGGLALGQAVIAGMKLKHGCLDTTAISEAQ